MLPTFFNTVKIFHPIFKPTIFKQKSGLLKGTLNGTRTLPLLIVLVVSFLLNACSGTTPTVSQSTSSAVADINQEIALVEQQSSPEKESRYITLAEQLRALGEINRGLSLINRVDPSLLNDSEYIRYVITAGQLYSADQAIFQMRYLLQSQRLDSLWPTLSLEYRQQLHRYKAETYSQFGFSVESVKERANLSALLTETIDITENNELLWQELAKLPLEELQLQIASIKDPLLSGWYELATINKKNEGSLDEKRIQVNNWVSANPNHPASTELPLDLQLLNSLIEMRPKQVALLLPDEGNLALAGKTIRDGFMAAYYNSGQEYIPNIRFYSTSSNNSINTIYDQAVSDGADLIIGPLEKEKLIELQQRQQLPVALLALNYITGDDNNNNNNEDIKPKETTEVEVNNVPSGQAMYQFGLSIEDESVQVASRAWLEGHRRAMVLASNADWSQRAANAFKKRWQEQGGTVTVDRTFDPNQKGENNKSIYLDIVETSLLINESNDRARKLKRLFGRNFEFEPRRRKDFDMIFLVAKSSQGQQIKPSLSFSYAGRVPVYSTSQIYSPQQSLIKNSDLNGIRFTTLPWTLEPEKRDPKLISDKVKVPPNYERLYALGIDAFQLYDRLQQLSRSPNTSIYGTTGKLTLDANKRIVREQPWAEIVEGRAKAFPYLTQDEEAPTEKTL